MKFSKLLITGLAVACMTAPAIAAVRPSVKPIDASVQKAVSPGVHRAGRAGAELKRENGFLPFLGGGLLGFAASSAVTMVTLGVVNQIVPLPLVNDIMKSVGVGNEDEPSSPG